jgi:hypothetical protein
MGVSKSSGRRHDFVDGTGCWRRFLGDNLMSYDLGALDREEVQAGFSFVLCL